MTFRKQDDQKSKKWPISGTVKPRFTGPLGGKELSLLNRETRYIGVLFTLIYKKSFFGGIDLKPGKWRDLVNRGTVDRDFTVKGGKKWYFFISKSLDKFIRHLWHQLEFNHVEKPF